MKEAVQSALSLHSLIVSTKFVLSLTMFCESTLYVNISKLLKLFVLIISSPSRLLLFKRIMLAKVLLLFFLAIKYFLRTSIKLKSNSATIHIYNTKDTEITELKFYDRFPFSRYWCLFCYEHLVQFFLFLVSLKLYSINEYVLLFLPRTSEIRVSRPVST